MKCEIHGTEMEYAGESPYGGDIWTCQQCIDEEEYEVWHNDAYQQDHPEEFPELWKDDDEPAMCCPKCDSTDYMWIGGDDVVNTSPAEPVLTRFDIWECHKCGHKWTT